MDPPSSSMAFLSSAIASLSSSVPSPSPPPPAIPSPSPESLLMTILNPSPPVAIATVLVLLLVPLVLHLFIFRSNDATTLPTFLLLGPSGSGKTSLMTYFASTPATTRTSQTPLSLECDVPASIVASSRYRSANDPTMRGHARFLLQDTPGHGKLRGASLGRIAAREVRGIVFVLDASLTTLQDTAGYLYDALLHVQRRVEAAGGGGGGGGGSRRKERGGGFRVLVACNKTDLFTALPAGRVQKLLEEELGRIRESRSKGLLDVQEAEEEERGGGAGAEREWLGEGAEEGAVTFEALSECGIDVEVLGGSVETDSWRESLGAWIGGAL